MRSKSKIYSRSSLRKSSSSTLLFSVLITCSFFIIILLAFVILSFPNGGSDSPKAREVNNIVHHHHTVESRKNGDERREVSSIVHHNVERGDHGEVNSVVHHTVERKNGDDRSDQWVEVISWEPRAVIYHNFLSQHECEHLINLAKPHMEKSTVVDEETGKSKDSRVRTSSGTFLARGFDETVRTIEERISDFTFLPVENGEGLQVLHYEVGQKYEPHFDYFLDPFNTKNGGQRIATVLMYLSDVEEGGETVFPSAKGNISAVPWWNELSECGKEGLSVKPKMGDALLFWSMKPDASLDPSSLHGGCPVIKGNKWSSTKWFHVEEYKV